MQNKKQIIDLLNKENETLNRELAKLDPNEEIYNKYMKHIITMELLYLIEEDQLDRFINSDISLDEIIKHYIKWSSNDDLDESITFAIRDNFFNTLGGSMFDD